MARKTKVAPANHEAILECIQQKCPHCGQTMWSDYDNEEQLPRLLVQQRFGAWMISLSDQKSELGSLSNFIPHLLQVTRKGERKNVWGLGDLGTWGLGE